MAKSIETVLFDLGGVLVELGGMGIMMEWTGGHWTEGQLWRKWLLSGAGRAFESGTIGPEEFARRMIEEFSLPIGPETYLDVFARWVVRAVPGAHELLDQLAGRCVRACLSNTNVLHWSRMADDMGLGARFEHAFPSHLTGRVKPDADAFLGALRVLRAEPERVLFFDDSPVNIEAAQALGISARLTRSLDDVRQALTEAQLLD